MCFVLLFQDDVEAEMKRLRLELKQTMDMYSTACKEALSARQQVIYKHLKLYFGSVYSILSSFLGKCTAEAENRRGKKVGRSKEFRGGSNVNSGEGES